MRVRWAVITGEYPPEGGGVSDYTRQTAHALADAGDDVHVLAPSTSEPYPQLAGVTVHALPDHFGLRGLSWASKKLKEIQPDRVLVQYVPHAFGMKAMNVPFALWVSRRTGPVDVMFHEIAYPRIPGQPWRHVLLARTTMWMARHIARRANRIFVSSLLGKTVLESFGDPIVAPVWLPVPTNVTTTVSAGRVARIRSRYAEGGARLVGHFGTYGELVTGVMERPFLRLLEQRPSVHALMIGRGSDGYVTDLLRREPQLTGRVSGTGSLTADEVAAHLAACDLLLQPYGDGVCTRRSTTMAGLALGVPIVTGRGHSTEPVWFEQEVVALADDSNPESLANLAASLLDDESLRTRIGRAGQDMYRRLFDISHTAHALRNL